MLLKKYAQEKQFKKMVLLSCWLYKIVTVIKAKYLQIQIIHVSTISHKTLTKNPYSSGKHLFKMFESKN